MQITLSLLYKSSAKLREKAKLPVNKTPVTYTDIKDKTTLSKSVCEI
jgi:hypothetical protein